ncbi:MAG TPA: helix-turn-helix transcriptional regulator, partial [Candidatus Eremiobacteraceae bacterium]|nr:helix-turn-helix transcriptional regulator [Candidatus Eremiobacteraceae bacterium]
EGSYSETWQDTTIVYEPFTCVYHAALTEHTDTIGPNGCRMFFIELLPSWVAVIDALGSQPDHLLEMHGGDAVWLALRLYHEFLTRDSSAALTAESLLFELCTHVARGSHDEEREPARLEGVDAALLSGFRDKLEIREIASAVNVHPSHLCRAFRRHRGQTIGDQVIGLRLQAVCRRLLDTSSSLSDIALDAGFTDQSHMNRTFKRLIGESPGAYRRRLRDGALS